MLKKAPLFLFKWLTPVTPMAPRFHLTFLSLAGSWNTIQVLHSMLTQARERPGRYLCQKLPLYPLQSPPPPFICPSAATTFTPLSVLGTDRDTLLSHPPSLSLLHPTPQIRCQALKSGMTSNRPQPLRRTATLVLRPPNEACFDWDRRQSCTRATIGGEFKQHRKT